MRGGWKGPPRRVACDSEAASGASRMKGGVRQLDLDRDRAKEGPRSCFDDRTLTDV